ncbi:MAG: hypothetical protein ACRDGS_02925 [Chloroflexota bacterium]
MTPFFRFLFFGRTEAVSTRHWLALGSTLAGPLAVDLYALRRGIVTLTWIARQWSLALAALLVFRLATWKLPPTPLGRLLKFGLFIATLIAAPSAYVYLWRRAKHPEQW